MMTKIAALVLTTALFSSVTNAACAKPEAPVLPEASSAVTAQMIKAKNDVNAYLADAEAYLSCARSDRDHNRMVKSMKKVGDGYNSVVRAYKDRMTSA